MLKVTLLGAACLAVLLLLTTAEPEVEKVRDAMRRASDVMALRHGLDKLYSRGLSVPRECPLAKFHGKRGSVKEEMDRRTNEAIAAAQLLLTEGFSIDDLQSETVTRELKRQLTNCEPPAVSCQTGARYRTPDGSCNNEANPTWGMAGTAQLRVLPAEYSDSLSLPRLNGVEGNRLPNPRRISNNVHDAPRGGEIRSQKITLQTFTMGQFLDHDLIKTPTISSVSSCCDNSDQNTCLPIIANSNNDRQFPQNYCMNFVRSAPLFCDGVRQQTNDLTSFIDASNVYGSSATEQAQLRNGAFMATAQFEGVTRLPDNPDQTSCIPNATAGYKCSLAGDNRVNVVPSLTTYHTMFVREHNRIAEALRHSFTDDENLFQETRKIVIGMMQKIVYDEFLPSFLSPDVIKRYRLSSDESYTYDATVNPTITNAFGIAFRMGHTWIPREMSMFDVNFRLARRINTEDTYLRPDVTYYTDPLQGMDGLAFWLSGANSPETDRIVEDVARNLLFLNSATNDSFDLAALNIQRGRDHGLPSFSSYRKHCELPELRNWNEIPPEVFDSNTVQRLRDAGYESPKDIDLFTGIIAETPVPGGTLGAVGECIIGRQFRALKFGDRFWYQGKAVGFNSDQVREIRRSSMSRLLCDSFGFERVQSPNAFRSGDQRILCRDIQGMQLNVFTNQATLPPPPPPPGGGNRRPPGGRSLELGILLDELINELEEEVVADEDKVE